MRLFERCLAQCWPEWSQWSPENANRCCAPLVTFIKRTHRERGSERRRLAAERQIEQLRLQVQLLRAWAMGTAGAAFARQAAGAQRRQAGLPGSGRA